MQLQWKLPTDARAMILEVAQGWGPAEVAVPYAGDFSIERSLRGLPLRFHSADVEVTSAALGAAWLDLPFPIRVAEKYAEGWAWLTPWLDTAERAAATLTLASNMTMGLDQPCNRYYARLHEAHRIAWEHLHAVTLARIRSARPNLASYTVGDPLAWLPSEIPVIYGGGEPTTLRGVQDLFEWDEKEPCERDTEALITAIMARVRWAIAWPGPWADMPADRLVGYCRTTNRAAPVHVYASGGPYRTRCPVQLLEDVIIPRLASDETPSEPMTLRRLSVREFSALRSHYLNPMIEPACPRLCVGILAAGKLLGAFAVNDSDGTLYTPGVPHPYAYLLSDFPIAPGVPRLSRLVLYAALSWESQLLIEQAVGHRVRALYTTAFSDRPVSMKYRGAGFELIERKESDGAHKRYVLNYVARLGAWSLAQVLTRWGK